MKNKMLDYINVILKVMFCLGIINVIIAISNIFIDSHILRAITLTSDAWIFTLLITIHFIRKHNDKVISRLFISKGGVK